MGGQHVETTLTQTAMTTPEIEGAGGFKLTTEGLGGGVTAVLERRDADDDAWATSATYSDDQDGTAVAETEPDAWYRLRLTAAPPENSGVKVRLDGTAL